jgi:ankyrin repeat protein
LLKSWFGNKPDTQEHPMSKAMASSLKEQLTNDPSLVSAKDERGWTFLHQEALAGSTATVKVLLAAGADPNAVTDHGMTPLQLARSLGWEEVVALLGNK